MAAALGAFAAVIVATACGTSQDLGADAPGVADDAGRVARGDGVDDSTDDPAPDATAHSGSKDASRDGRTSAPDGEALDGDRGDAGELDAGFVDTSADDASALDAHAGDASVVDASAVDASTPDASAVDASAVDASAVDASATDASTLDASAGDGGPPRAVELPPLGILTDTCVLTRDGEVFCWNAELRSWRVNHAALAALPQDDAPSSSTCILTAARGVLCRGANNVGQLGIDDPRVSQSSSFVTPLGLSSGVRAIAVSGDRRCATLDDGGLRCWGQRPGDGSERSWKPVTPTGLGAGVRMLTSGGLGECALLDDGAIRCFGLSPRPVAARNAPPAKPVFLAQSRSAAGRMCAVLEDGRVACFGDNTDGQLGDGSKLARDVWTPMSGVTDARVVALGDKHTCVLSTRGDVRCVGSNLRGELGTGDFTSSTSLVPVLGLASGVSMIATAATRSCALHDQGGITCWPSYEPHGQLSLVPRVVPNVQR
jgi:hypothetical protein